MGLSLQDQQQEQTRIWNEEIKPFVKEAKIKTGKIDYHTLAELRAKHILEKQGYKVELEKPIGALRHWDLRMPNYKRTLDVYATKPVYIPAIDSNSNTGLWFTRTLVIEIGKFGDGTYHSKKRMIARDANRKIMVCSKFNLSPDYYIQQSRDELASRKYAMDNNYFIEHWNL